MALIVEDGTGKSDAESYLSVADAGIYNTAYVGDTTWTAATTANKEIALRKGTQYLDTKYQGRWRGERRIQDQALAWPRSNVEDNDGFLLANDSIPAKVERATAELAIKSLSTSLYVDETAPGAIKRTKKVIGPITKEVEYTGSGGQQKRFTIVENLVAGLIESGNEVERS